MNKLQPYITFFIFNLLLLSGGSVFSQTEILQFNETTLDKVISSIEQQSNFIFNYDPQLLQAFGFSGYVNTTNIDEALTLVFARSPYTYDISGETILIYKAEPQIYRVCGSITDATSEELLIGANVYATDTYIGSQTDTNGFFDFSLTTEKNQIIEVSYIGYFTKSIIVSNINPEACIDISLEVDRTLFGKEIIIKEYILDGISQGDAYSALELNFDRLSRSHSNVEHDILKTAQLLPGITSIDDSATNLQIRGSSPGQNLILWEDAPIYNAGHIFGMISAINPFSIDNMSIYKGAHDPKFDNRVGGIVDLSLSDKIHNEAHGSAGTTLTEVHGSLEIPFIKNRLSFDIAGRRNFAGLYNSPALRSYTDKVFQLSIIDDQASGGDFQELNTQQRLNYHDWNTKLIYQHSERLKLNLGMYQNAQDFDYTYGFKDDPFEAVEDITVNTSVISGGAEWQVNNSWLTKGEFYTSGYDNTYVTEGSENGLVTNSNEQTNGIEELNISFSNDVILSSKLRLNAGYTYNEKKVDLMLGENVGFEPGFLPAGEEVATFHSAFQSLSYGTNNLQLEAGNRSTYYQEMNGWFHSPRLNLQYRLTDALKIKLDGGIYHQFISQLINVGNSPIKVDNPLWILNTSEANLSQKANKFSAGFIYNKSGWLIDVEAYHNQVDGLSTLSPLSAVLGSTNPFSKGSSKVKGVDLLLKKQWSGINAWVNYSFSKADYNFPDISNTSIVAPNDIRHNLNLVTTYGFNNFQISLSANYHSGLPYTLPFLQFNEDDPNAEPPFLFSLRYDDYNTFRLAPYVRADMNVSYRFNANSSGSLQSEISISVINILDRTNVFERGYYVDYNDDTALYSLANNDRTLLGRTPLLLVRFYW